MCSDVNCARPPLVRFQWFLVPSFLFMSACPHDSQPGESATEPGQGESSGLGDEPAEPVPDPTSDPGTSTVEPGTTSGSSTGIDTMEPGTSSGDRGESSSSGDEGISSSSTGSGGAVCGDKIVDDGEECDFGEMNADAEYGGCNSDCTWQPHCLDEEFQPGHEECDPSDPLFGEAAACNDSCMWKGGVVFVTSQAFKGDLGGQAGADAQCQKLASAAGLKMEYRAWLSVGGNHARDHIPVADEAYYLLSGEVVAAGKSELLGGKLKVGISVTEKKEKKDGVALVWTNTKSDGTVESVDFDCQSFSKGTLDYKSFAGVRGNADGTWTNAGVKSLCSENFHLYCFGVVP